MQKTDKKGPVQEKGIQEVQKMQKNSIKCRKGNSSKKSLNSRNNFPAQDLKQWLKINPCQGRTVGVRGYPKSFWKVKRDYKQKFRGQNGIKV